MCGIVGLWYRDRSRSAPEAVVRAMCQAIVHRGPDDEGILVDRNLGMGMRRLSIIDLSGGHQPIFNEDERVAIVYNGEVYNHEDLRQRLEGLGHTYRTRSDTETILHGHEEWGTGLPGRLNGMFAYSVWDSRERRLTIARDQIGIKPLYIWEDEEKIAWASEVKALFAVPGVVPELDLDALGEFLTLGYVPEPRTMFRGIRKLPAATVLVADDSGVRSESYWDLEFREDSRSADEWCEELRALLDDAVRRQLMSDVPLGAFLSGGIDSSAIVATMHRLGVGHIATYSIGFGGDDTFHNELDKAEIVAKAFGTDHHEILVEPDVSELIFPLIRHLDEPITDTSFIVTYLVSKMARETVTVILSGVGGDEIFAGYRRYLWPRLQRLHRWVPGFLDRGLLRPLVRRLPVDRGSRVKSMLRYLRGFLDHADLPDGERYQGYVGIFSEDLAAELLAGPHGGVSPSPSRHVAACYDAARAPDPLGRMLYADLKTSLVDSLLAFTDKMTMAVSLEARVPLLDVRLVELAARIPSNLKLTGARGLKDLFKRAMSDRLPPEIIHRRKQGFGTPISRWFRASLRPLLEDLLAPETLRRRGYFDPDVVWRIVKDHLEERADHSEHILALLTFEAWHRTFLDSKVTA